MDNSGISFAGTTAAKAEAPSCVVVAITAPPVPAPLPADNYTKAAILIALIWLVVQSMLTRRAVQTTITDEEKNMSATETGLANLQALQAQFQAFVNQITGDITSLSAAINAAIAALGTSEDPAVQAVVDQLQTSLTALQAQDATVQNLNTTLSAAENPPAGNAQANATKAQTKS